MLPHVIRPCKYVSTEWALAIDWLVAFSNGPVPVIYPNMSVDLLLTWLCLGAVRRLAIVLVSVSYHVLSYYFVSVYEVFP